MLQEMSEGMAVVNNKKQSGRKDKAEKHNIQIHQKYNHFIFFKEIYMNKRFICL